MAGKNERRIVEKVLFKDHALLSSYSSSSKQLCGPISKQCTSCSQAAMQHGRPEQIIRVVLCFFLKHEELVEKSATHLKNLSLTDDISLNEK